MHPLNNLRVLKYLVGELDVSEQNKLNWYRHWVIEGFDALEEMLNPAAGTGEFCHGDTPTLADLCLIPQVFNAERFECDLAAYPTIQRITANCLDLEAFRLAAPGEQPDAS
jgi:maleylacetoacetate isomerase